jgi:hypothetical protein
LAEVSRFKAKYRQGRQLATVNHALGVPRAAINWGSIPRSAAAPDDPVPSFRRDDQSTRNGDRLIYRYEEQRLLAACVTMNSAERK